MPTSEAADQPIILLTGGSGYVGGRLIPLLEQQGVRLRCLARNPDKLRPRVQAATEIVPGRRSRSAVAGPGVAGRPHRLLPRPPDVRVEGLRAGRPAGGDRTSPRPQRQAGVRRIIYLGGLGDDADPKLSPHLRSRHEVGKILRDSGVETIEFRASMVIGAGSLSFDLMKSLTDRLPVMLCPRWLTTPTQPIAVDDVLAYLLAAKDLPPGESRIFEIGGTDVATYGDLIREYARQTRAAAVADLGAGADAVPVEPLAGPGDARQFRGRAAPDRRAEEPHGGPGSIRPGRVPDPPDGGPGGDSQGDRRCRGITRICDRPATPASRGQGGGHPPSTLPQGITQG